MFGIVSRVLPDADLLPAARALATEIATETAPVSVALTKRLLWDLQSEPDAARAEEVEARAFWWAGQQPDAREGVQAFRERRPHHTSLSRRNTGLHSAFRKSNRVSTTTPS